MQKDRGGSLQFTAIQIVVCLSELFVQDSTILVLPRPKRGILHAIPHGRWILVYVLQTIPNVVSQQMSYAKVSVLDTTRHPYDSAAVLNWLLEHWESANPALVILVQRGDGKDAINRVRVTLAQQRAKLKRSGEKKLHEFSVLTSVFPWSREDGSSCEAIEFVKTQSVRDVMMEVIADKLGE